MCLRLKKIIDSKAPLFFKGLMFPCFQDCSHHPLNITCLRCERVLPRTENEFQSRFVGFWGLDFDYTQPPLRLLVCKEKNSPLVGSCSMHFSKGGWEVGLFVYWVWDVLTIFATWSETQKSKLQKWVVKSTCSWENHVQAMLSLIQTWRWDFAESICFPKLQILRRSTWALWRLEGRYELSFFWGLEIQEKMCRESVETFWYQSPRLWASMLGSLKKFISREWRQIL